MPSSRLLLVEDEADRAERIAEALSALNFECYTACGVSEAQEALTLHPLDLILLTPSRDLSMLARSLRSAVKPQTPAPLLIALGECDREYCDAILPPTLDVADLGKELCKLQRARTENNDRVSSQVPVFDFSAFCEQMGNDPDLMSEIVNIFFEESKEQLRDMHEAFNTGDLVRLSRLAHSLKGSLSSLHAPQARHWAETLESTAKAGDTASSRQYLAALEESISALSPRLRELLAR